MRTVLNLLVTVLIVGGIVNFSSTEVLAQQTEGHIRYYESDIKESSSEIVNETSSEVEKTNEKKIYTGSQLSQLNEKTNYLLSVLGIIFLMISLYRLKND